MPEPLEGLRTVAFRVPMRVPVMGVTDRRGWLVEGGEGWGECSPLPSWSPDEVRAAAASAREAATHPFPRPVRDEVEVNAMVPRLGPEEARRLVAGSDCRTVKVKVGDGADEARVEAVRDALGPRGLVRLDANGAWPDAPTAERALRRLAPYDIEYCEDPVGDPEELARLRPRSPVPIAAESCVRTVEDAARIRHLEAADVVVLKPQRLGGIRASLRAAEAAGVPAVASSALETSVGLSAVLAVAAALPTLPFACGIGTATLLGTDVTGFPLVPRNGVLVPRRVAPTEPVPA